ncbi:PAS domain S-box protein [Salinimicrobium catena]|uniref:PAS domain S-box protein n=1 Tax=Salinimicrobium catena TaxID=390640 RepID=UPI002FE4F234
MIENYAKIFSKYPVPSMVLEPVNGEWIIRNVNDKYCEVTGRKKEELVDRNIKCVFPEYSKQENENWQLVEASLQKVLRTKEGDRIPEIRYDIFNPENGVFDQKYWMAENYPVFGNDQSTVEFILHTATDRTAEVLEQILLKEKIAQKVGEHKHFIDANPDGLYSLDTKGRFLSANQGLLDMTGTTEEELLEMDFLPFCAPHHRERTLSFFQKALAGEPQIFEADFISADDRRFSLRLSIVPIKHKGEITGVYGIAKDITESERAKELVRQKEKELEKKELKFSALIQEAFDLVSILDLEGNYKFVSESYFTVLGIPPENLIGKNAFDFVHPDDRDRVFDNFSEIKNEKKTKISPLRFQDGNGNWRWVETNVTNLLDDPNVEGIVINSREVTDLILKNQELQRVYERYELAVAATGDLIYDWDLESDTVKRFFTGKEKQFGYQKEEMSQRHFWREHVHPDELEGLRKLLSNTLQDPQRNQIRTQYRFKRADGTYAHLIDRGMIVRDGGGKAIRMIGATSDISGLVNRRNALRLANKRFTYAMKATKEMIWDWDITKGYIDRGKAFKKMFGIEVNEKPSVENFWFERVVEKDRDRIKDSLYKTLADPSLDKWREEYKIWKPDGQNAYVIDRGFIIRDHEGKAVRMVGATLDVTESRQMLKKIKKQNKLLKEVAWEQAHIVRAPIARLKGLLNLFDEDYNDEWEKEEILQLIKDSAEELDRIVTGIIRKTEGIKIEK